MRTVIIVVTIFVTTCKCYQFPDAEISHYYIPIANLRGINESIVYFKDNDVNDDDMLLNSLILRLFLDQPIRLRTAASKPRFMRNGLQNRDPNVIILTKTLSLEDSYFTQLKSVFQSFWSPVYVIITERNGNRTCANGTISKVFFKNAQNYMNNVWHKHQIIRIIVSFPYTCPQHFIVYAGKKLSGRNLYDRTIKIIKAKNEKELKTAILENIKLQQLTHGYPLKTNIFDRFPTSIRVCKNIEIFRNVNFNYTNSFCGMDALVMHDFLEHYRYDFSFSNDERCNTYGYGKNDAKVLTGSLGCIARRQIDISFNSRFMVPYTTVQPFLYLFYITTDSLTVVLKRPEVLELWHYAYNTFSPSNAINVFFLILLLGFLMWSFTWITNTMSGQTPKKLHRYIVDALISTLFGFSVERSDRFRILRGTSLLASIILLTYYQGNVNYQFTTRTRPKEIKTLQQLYESKCVLFVSPTIRDLLMRLVKQSDKTQMDFYKRTQIKNDSTDIGHLIDHPNMATLGRGEDVQMEVLLNHTDESGAPLMYTIDENLQIYYLSYISRTDFLFLEETIIFMMRMVEAGLPKKYYAWTRRILKIGDRNIKTGPEPRPFDKTKLNNLRVAYSVLAFGYSISTFSFLIEMYRGRRHGISREIVNDDDSSEIREN